MIVFGPVPSRRLGQSIGINNIPPKTCSYSCVYCQIGRTNHMMAQRRAFYSPEEIYCEAAEKLQRLKQENRQADYFSFVPDGEPTLDLNLGKSIEMLKPLGIKIAVITNASLLWMDDVKDDLMKADWVSVSIDSADEEIWRKIDRPHGKLKHRDVLKGIADFSKIFKGTLVTETMLIKGINDNETSVEKTAEFLAEISPSKAYFLVPTRPPAESGADRPSADFLKYAAAITWAISGVKTECIAGDEKEDFFFTDDIAGDLLGIASVHPVREEAIKKILKERNEDESVISRLIEQGKINEVFYNGKKFYKRAF